MPYLTTTTMAFGVVLSAVASMLCWLDCDNPQAYLHQLPWSSQLFSQPGMALGAGALLIIIGFLCCPHRHE